MYGLYVRKSCHLANAIARHKKEPLDKSSHVIWFQGT